MVYRRLLSFKTGRNPSLVNTFPYDGNYTGTQKLLLIRSRLFGHKIGGTDPSGTKQFRKTSKGRAMMIPHKKSLIEFLRYFPGLEKRGPIDFERRFLQEKVDRKQGQRIRREEAKQREKQKK